MIYTYISDKLGEVISVDFRRVASIYIAGRATKGDKATLTLKGKNGEKLLSLYDCETIFIDEFVNAWKVYQCRVNVPAPELPQPSSNYKPNGQYPYADPQYHVTR